MQEPLSTILKDTMGICKKKEKRKNVTVIVKFVQHVFPQFRRVRLSESWGRTCPAFGVDNQLFCF